MNPHSDEVGPHGPEETCDWCGPSTVLRGGTQVELLKEELAAVRRGWQVQTAWWDDWENTLNLRLKALGEENAVLREKVQQYETLFGQPSVLELQKVREENKALRLVLAEHGYFGRDR